MPQLFLIFAFLLLAAEAVGQKTVCVIDGQTGNALPGVAVADNAQVLGETGIDGTILLLPNENGKIIFAHELYDRVEVAFDVLPDTLALSRAFLTLPEVLVMGQKPKRIDSGVFSTPEMTLDRKLASIQVPEGVNLLGPIAYGASKLFPSRKQRKETKLQRLKRILDKATR